MGKKVLVTGGAGFIGRHLCSDLVRRGYSVTIVDSLINQVHGPNPDVSFLDGFRFHRCSVGDINEYGDALLDCHVLVHLAAQTGTGQSMYKISDYFSTNVQETSKLVEFLSTNSHCLEKVIVASSRAIYGEGAYHCNSHGVVYPFERRSSDALSGDFSVKCPVCDCEVAPIPTNERCPAQPSSYYGVTKHVQEQLILLLGRTLNIDAYALRFQNVIGPFQSLSNPYTGILAVFANLARQGKEINVFEDGEESRDFVYVADAVKAVVNSIENPSHFNGVLNVGSGSSTTVLQVANIINDYFGRKSKIVISGEYRIGDIRHNLADLSNVRKILNFTPDVPFGSAVFEFLQWAEKQELERDANYAKSVNELKENGLLVGRRI